MTTKNRRKKKLESHIQQVDSEIADVDKKFSEAEGDLQTYYREALVKLKEVKTLANFQLERLHETGEEAWDDLKDEVDEAIERVRTNLDALMARFRDEAMEKPPVRGKKPVRKSTAGKSTSGTNRARAKSKAKGKSTSTVKNER